MWSGRTIAALATLLGACAPLPTQQQTLERSVTEVLERRGLGRDALGVIDNLMRHGPTAPRATAPLVLELLARPLAAAEAESLFMRAVPAVLTPPQLSSGPRTLDELLRAYLKELAEAQRLLRAAVSPFDDSLLLEELASGLPSSARLLQIELDPIKLERANLLFLEATARFAQGIAAVDVPARGLRIESELATIVIGTRGNDVHRLTPARHGRASVIVDPGGDDQYLGSDLALNGFSAIVDFSGNDRYAMEGPGLGAAIAGAAVLVDLAGDDSYQAKFFAQGAAAFGVGALVDFAGDDRYRVEAWGQGFGLGGGLGLLWDGGGDDRYSAGAVPDPYHRAGGISGAQGAAFGYRGRLAGGIGILRDDAGDDTYEAEMFAQGLGYYYAIGVLWDRGGRDTYRAVQYAQGNGVHQAVGVLRDEAGDDRYEMSAIYGQGMGLDVAVGLLVDDAGNDAYRARAVAQGAATANGFGLLADRAGADRFEVGPSPHAWGHAEWMRGLPSVGVLLHGRGAQFVRDGKAARPGELPVTVQPPTALACPAQDAGDALLCRLDQAADVDAVWRELQTLLAEDPATPLAGSIAVGLARRPPPRAIGDEIAARLAQRESCNVRALALRGWPTLPAAQAGVRSPCYRLQAAARAALARLGAPLPADAALPTFLRALPPQDDTF